MIGNASNGTIAASASEPLDLLIDGDRREQDPRQWWEAFRAVTRRMMETPAPAIPASPPGRIEGLIFSGQMQDLIALDADLEPVRGAILYSDGRAAAQAEALADSLASPAPRDQGMRRFLAIVGNPLEGSLPLPKLMWLREHEPQAFARTRHVLISAKDFLIARLTGVCVGDVAACSTAGAMDIRAHRWSPEPFVDKPGAADLAFGLREGFVNAVPFLNAGDVHRWATRVFAPGAQGHDTADDYAAMHRLLAASAPGAGRGGVLHPPGPGQLRPRPRGS
ncbi:FGGY family carbohydrate kinase [Bifidobacterium pullorum]|uniref:FGGY family carbohydrate kinase n=1 Tax=Bifidobacterium pullorum TaxID=78448 RepID=UPI003F7BEF56